MSDNSTRNDAVLVLSDGTGNLYAIPRNVVEQHLVTGEERGQIEKALGDDVSGYAMMAGANLAGANLAGASTAGANLAGASTAGANLAGASTAGASTAASSVMLSGFYVNIANLD